jgi:hypothetical protein
LDDDALAKILNFGFINRYTTLKYIMKQATIEPYHNNRKKIFRISLPYSASDHYKDHLFTFLKQLGILPVSKDDNRIFIEDPESLILCFQVLDEAEHFYYSSLRDYVVNYYFRIGYKIHESSLFRVFKEYPQLKRHIKNSLFAHYRNNGIHLGTLIQLFMKSGLQYKDYYKVIPNLTSSPIKSVKRLPRSAEKFFDMETETTFNVINGFVTHNSGKTEAISVVCDACMVLFPYMAAAYPDDVRLKKFKHGLWIGIFAPSLDQSKTTFDRMRSRLSSNNGNLILKEFGIKFETNRGDTIQLSNGSFTRCMTASETSHIESKTFHMAVCEESQDISPFKLKKSIQPMLSSTAGTLVMIGTANTTRNHLLDMTEYNKKRMREPGARQNHFEVDYIEACRHNPKYAKHIDKEIDRLGGVDSDEFKMSYRNIFCLERGMAFEPKQLELYHETENPIGCFQDYETVQYYHGKNTVCVGIDVGKSQDSTVLTAIEVDFENPIETHSYIAYNKRLIGWMELIGDDFNAQFFQIYDFLERMQAQIVYMDTTGKGDVLYDRVAAAMPGIDILPYVFSRPSKSKLYKALLHDFASRRITLPGGKNTKLTKEYNKFYQQMSELEKEYHGEFLDCHKPVKKGRGDLPHDDYCVLAGTLIMVMDAITRTVTLKRIEDVKIGDLVVSHKSRWKPVIKTYTRTTSEDLVCLDIFGMGVLKVTANHPICVGTDIFIPAGELKAGDAISYHFPTDKGEDQKFLSFAAEDYIKLLGYFMACGTASSVNNVTTFRLFDCPNVSKIEESLVSAIKEFTKSPAVVTKGSKGQIIVSSTQKAYKELVMKSYNNVMDRKHRTVPEEVIFGGVEAAKAFLTGLFQAGAVSSASAIKLNVENKITAYQVRDLLFKIGIVSFVEAPLYRAKKVKSDVDMKSISKDDFYVVSIVDQQFLQKAVDLLDIPTRRKYNNVFTDDDLTHKLYDDHCDFVIKSVLRVAEPAAKVYNLEVEDDHSYTLTKSTVHNCDSIALACWSARQESVYNVQEVDSPFVEYGKNSFLNR